jgi:monoterpene epsilon-lactone hydrolase
MGKSDDSTPKAGGARLWLGRRELCRGVAAVVAAAPALGGAAAAPKAEASDPSALRLGPRTIPTPQTISPAARQFLAEGAARVNALMAGGAPATTEPPPQDAAAWKARIQMVEKAMEPRNARLLQAAATVEWKKIGGVKVAVGTPHVMRNPDRARLQIHGGGFLYLGGAYVAGQAAQMAAAGGCTVYSVDYRRAPDFPFPAALDDCVSVFREIVKHYAPRKVAIAGESAGGNLAAAATLKIRDLGLPLPGAVGMLTPVTDFTRAGDTHQANFGVDTVLTTSPAPHLGPDALAAIYAPGQDLKQPYLSPLFGDFTKGFPPTFLQSGTRDVLLSDTVRMHRALVKAGVEAELHVWEAMPHGGFGQFTPEDAEVHEQFAKFFEKHAA